MYDYGLSTLTQYQLTVRTTARIRGALLCRTDRGDYIIREFKGSERKLKKQQELLLKMRDAGCMVDVYVQNEEGSLFLMTETGYHIHFSCGWKDGSVIRDQRKKF